MAMTAEKRRKWQYSAKRIRACFIASGDAQGITRTGTGFVLFDQRTGPVIVTNAHVLDPMRGDEPHHGYHLVEVEVEGFAVSAGAPNSKVAAPASFGPRSDRVAVAESDDAAIASLVQHKHGFSDNMQPGTLF